MNMKILFLPNWPVVKSNADSPDLQRPDKYVYGEKYWFFRYFPEDTTVDVIDVQPDSCLYKFERKIKFYIWQAIRAFKVQRRYDVIISHGAQSGLVLSLLRTLVFRKRPPHIIFDIGGMNGGRDNRLERAMLRLALSSKPYIICHSRIIIENYQRLFPNLLPRTAFIPFGVDAEEFRPDPSVPEKNRILSFGYAKRDYPTLIEAFKSIRGSTARLKIIGMNTLPEAEGRDDIEVVPKVPIHVLRREIQSSLFVVIPLPVYKYSYGQMSLLQSMSLGKAVIVTETPGTIDYCGQLQEGLLTVRPYDVADMKDKLEMLLSDAELRKELAGKARMCVQKHFSEERMGRAVSAYIKRLNRIP